MPLIMIMFLLRSAFFFSLTCRFLLKFKEHALLGGAMGEQSLPLMWPGSDPCVDSICGSSSLSMILSIALGGFSLGTPVVPSPQKPTIPNSNSFRKQVDEELPNAGCATSKSLFIHFFMHSFIYLVILFL